MKEDTCDVLVVGAGPVGLTAGLLFQRLGVNALLVDRRSSINLHPKARNLKVRGAEIFRSLGIEKAIREEEFPKEARRVMWLSSFCGEKLAEISIDYALAKRFSPCEPVGLSQARLEEIIKNSIQENHVSVRYKTEFIEFVEEEKGILAQLQKESGETCQVRAKYLLAADGARSPVRKLLQIPALGSEDMGRFVSIYFRANPYPKAPYRPSAVYFMLGDASFGRFIQSVNCQDEWLMGIKLSPEQSQDNAPFDTDYCLRFIRETFEIPDLDIEILDIGYWNMRVQIAESFRKGRAFLAGDAAHLLTPAGGYGLQTGIEDVHNLCWKLAAVLRGEMPEETLDSYHEERFPTVQSNIDWSKNNQKGYTAIMVAGKLGDQNKLQDVVSEQWPILNSIGQDIGFSYASSLMVPDGTEALKTSSTQYLPSARPGCRAPHLWLQGPHGVISTIDLFVDSFILLTDSEGASWPEKIKSINPALSFRHLSIGEGGNYQDIHQDFHELYGIERGGAVLVRPDGHVYWRSVNGK